MKHLLRSFFFSAPFVLCAFLLTLATVLPAGPANAQAPVWTQIKPNTFSGQIHIVKFIDVSRALFDANGAPLVGFVSDGPEIFRTTDGGKNLGSWQLATITGASPTPFISGWVNDISFENPDTGVAIIQGNTNPAESGVLITKDGGATWTVDNNLNTPNSGNGIYWDALTNRIFVASLDKGFVYSPDFGASWTVIDTNKYYTGFAFTSKSRGVVSTMGSNPSGGLPSNYWKYTTDGGLNWDTSRMFYETWQPVAIPTTETYFAAAINVGGSAIMRSDNDGYSFIDVPTFPEGRDVLNDCMQGDGCSIFTASTDEPMGIWYSNNDGANWQTMQPPLMPGVAPNPPLDTRFYVSPTTIWSFTTNVLWYTPRVLTADIHVWPDTINFTKAGCDVPTDTVVHIFGCNCSASPQLTGSTVTQSQPQDQLTVNTGTIPRALCSSTSAPLGNPDFVTISYKPTSSTADVGVDTLKFSENGVEHDTTIAITGNAAIPGISVPTQRFALYAPACGGEVDTCFTITNTGCTPITILSSTPFYDDPCILYFDTVPPQGVILDPTSPSYTFCVHFRPSLKAGTENANIYFTWRSGSKDTNTRTIKVVAITTTTIQPSFRGFHIGFVPGHPLSCCNGGIPTDTTIYFINTTCDTLLLHQPNIFGSTNPNVFEFNDAKPPIVFPVTVPPGQFIPLGVHINCHQGVDSEKVEFTYTVGTSGSDCSSILTARDTAVLAFKSSGNLTLPTAKPSGVVFNGVSCCDSSQTRTVTITNGCTADTLTASGLNFDATKGTFYIVSPLTVPMPLSPGQVVTIQIGYRPACSDTGKGTLTTTFSNGTTLTTTVLGTTSNVAEAALSTSQINFDTLPCGTSKCDSVWVKNASCGPIEFGGIVPPGPANPAFIVTPPPTGSSMSRGDSLPILVCLNPAVNNSSGSLTDGIIVAILNANGTPASFDTLSFAAYVEPTIPASTVTPLTDTMICDTSTLDEQFTVTNTGQCYTYDILGATTSNTQVTVTPVGTSYPVHVAVGGSQAFTVHFGQTAPGILTGMVTLTDSAGNNITVPYNITVDSCNNAGHFVLIMPGDSITTPNCTTGELVFTAEAGGGSGTITAVTVTGSTRFAATTPTTGSMPFTDTITFDPNLTGGNTATLTILYKINGVPGDTTLTLTGVVTGSKFRATVNVVSETAGAIKPNDTMVKDFEVILEDTVFDAVGMNKLSVLIRFDGDLLWKVKYTTDTGWTVDNATYQDNQGLHLVLDYGGTAKHFTGVNDTVVKATLFAAVSDSSGTVAYVGSANFNDSAFEACTLKALNGSGTAPFSIDTSCTTAMLERSLPLNLQPYSGIEVIPNPAHKDGSAATLHFTSNVSAPMTVDVLNMLGNSVAQLSNGPVEKGDHTLSIPTNDMSEGAYFVRISVNGYTVVRKFVLEKE